MDVSGDPKHKNHKYLSIVIGTEESIESLLKKSGIGDSRMSKLRVGQQDHVAQRLKFDNNNRIAFCIQINRKEIIDYVKKRRKIKQQRMSDGRLVNLFHHVFYELIRPEIESFLLIHGYSLSNLQIHCDDDCYSLIKECGLKPVLYKGSAFKISDRVAWCNNKRIEMKTVKEKNFVDEIKHRMVMRLTR